jgi:hypothetical protein
VAGHAGRSQTQSGRSWLVGMAVYKIGGAIAAPAATSGCPGGDDAVSRTISAVRLDDTSQIWYHRPNINLQALKNNGR